MLDIFLFTKPNKVKIANESFFATTDIFGIRLHYSLFRIEKLE